MKRTTIDYKYYSILFSLFFLLSANQNTLHAQKTWLGNTTNWLDASNWNPIGTPEADDDVNIPATSNDPEITAGAIAKSVDISANVVLTIQATGALFVEGSNGSSIVNEGTIVNFGELNVSNSGSIGIDNSGNISNEVDATINVNNTQTWGILSSGDITNKRTINIGLAGSIGGRGLQNAATLNNEAGASININNTGGDAIYNTSSNGLITNHGAIMIGNPMDAGITIMVSGIFNSREIQNFGQIKIDNVSSSGIITLSGVFNNELNSNIEITNARTGLSVLQSANFINKSTIVLSEASREGISVDRSSFLNDVGGLITIDNTQESGMETGIDALFTNKGFINIGNNGPISGRGLQNRSGFSNDVGGIVTINQTASEGLYNGSTPNTTNTFTNKGAITVNPPTNSSKPAIYNNSASFVNQKCATLRSTGSIFNPGTIQNDGFFSSNGLFTSNNSFTNNGLFNYLFGSYSTGNTTNNEIIIDFRSGSCSGISPAFSLGNPVDFTIHGVYTDMGLSNPAGTYDAGTNTFTCNLDPGMYTLFVEVEDTDNDCSYVAEWKVTIESALPPGWESSPDGIGCTDGSEASFDNSTETFTITSEGCYDSNYYSTSDSHGFVYTELCGDGEIIAEIQSVDGDGWAGISMRESTDPGAKMLQLLIDGVFLTQRQMRTSTGGYAFKHQFQTQGKNWLRLTRAGSTLGAHHSSDGVNWSTVLVTNIAMPNCIPIGLVTMNNQPSGTLTATFGNVEVKSNAALYNPNTIDYAESESSFSVYPNPASDQLWLNLPDNFNEEVAIKVYNQLGQLVMQQITQETHTPTLNLDVGVLNPGAYWVAAISNDERQTARVIIE